MKCPRCKQKENVEVSKADGFSQDVRECTKCGLVWTFNGTERVVISEGKMIAAQAKAFTFPPVLDHTRFSSCEDELIAEDMKVWFA